MNKRLYGVLFGHPRFTDTGRISRKYARQKAHHKRTARKRLRLYYKRQLARMLAELETA